MPRSSATTTVPLRARPPAPRTAPGWTPRAARSAPSHPRRLPGPAPAAPAGSVSTEDSPTRIAPRSRRCRVSARVSTPDTPTTPGRGQLVVQDAPGPPGRRPPGRVAHHVAGDLHPAGLRVLVVDPGVADVRRGHHHDLPVVRRVGQRLLVAGHPGGEDGLADRLPHRAVRLAAERPPVLQHERTHAPGSLARARVTCDAPSRRGRSGSPRRKVATTRAGSSRPAYGVLRLRLAERGRVDRPPGGRVDQHERGRRALLQRPAAVEPADPGRRRRHPLGQPAPVQQPGLHHGQHRHRQRGLQPEHAGPGRAPLGLLVLQRVRRVVGGHRVDGAVGQPGPQRGHVLGRPQRRVDLVDRVVRGGQLVGEQQVVRGHLGGDPGAAGLGPAQDLHRAGGRDVADVQPGADVRRPAARRGRSSPPRRRPASRPARAGPPTTPSFICAPSVSRGSSACWATTPSNALTYSSARRISTRVGDRRARRRRRPAPGPRSRPSRPARPAARRPARR